jgi:hypothetical protein
MRIALELISSGGLASIFRVCEVAVCGIGRKAFHLYDRCRSNCRCDVGPARHAGMQSTQFARLVRRCLFPRPYKEDPCPRSARRRCPASRLDVLIVGRTGIPNQKAAGQHRIGSRDLLTRLVESGRWESNPHDQLGRLVTPSRRPPQFAAVTSRYNPFDSAALPLWVETWVEIAAGRNLWRLVQGSPVRASRCRTGWLAGSLATLGAGISCRGWLAVICHHL